jgi:hypothetical protein
MGDQVFEIGRLKERALELLRRHDSYMSAGGVAAQLGVPTYAATAALDAARLAGQVEHAAGAGWRALSQEPARPVVDESQRALGMGS